MNPRYLILLTTLVFLGFSSSTLMAKPDKCPDWPNCPNPDPDPDVTANYTAALDGNFTFGSLESAEPVLIGLTANSQGTSLSGDFDIEVSQDSKVEIYDEAACPDSLVPCPSDPVYILNYHCPELVDSGELDFKVMAGNWEINHIGAKGSPGHVYIAMRNLKDVSTLKDGYGKADFDFDLHGDVAEGALFPPETGTPIEITLTEYKLWAGIGGREKILCNSDGRPELLSHITLKITRSD